ncbi:hypothetical protein KI387_010498, partial [Taxus chinensis]
DEVAIQRKDNSRLTIEEIQMLDLSDIPEGTKDNESVLDTSYDGLNEDQYVFLAIDWSIAEKASIAGELLKFFPHTKAWLISWGM